MPDDLNPSASLESPPTTTPEPEPEGVVEVQGQKLAPVSAIVAERERVRHTERERAAKEREPLQQQLAQTQQQAQQLAAELDALRQAHAPKQPDVPDIPDDEAERVAREFELYTPTGLDLSRAKRVIARQRAEITKVAQQVAQEAVRGPQEDIFRQASKQNFIWAASQRDAHGNPIVDPKALAEQWAQLPAELTSKPEVAEHLLNTVAGRMMRTGQRPPTAPQQEPTFTEAAGGRRSAPYTMTTMGKRLATASGMTEKAFTDVAKTYQPGATNFLE